MADIKYKISGKSDTGAITKTELAMKKLGNTISNVSKIAGGFALAKVMQGISKVTSGSTEKFLQQNKAMQQYSAVITKAGQSLENLGKIQQEVGRNNLFDGDSLNDAMKYCAQMGLTEEQIKNVMKASTDLAASGVMPLDQAVKALSGTYSGQLGQLKKIQPELANLTKEQLEHGDAVAIVAEKYQGVADAMSNTFSGRNDQWNNSFSDLQASVGSIFEKVKYFEEGKWLGPINKLTEWFNENSTSIAGWIASIPDNIKVVADYVVDILKEIFSAEWWENNGKNVANILLQVFTALGTSLVGIVVSLGDTVWDLIKNTAPALGKGILNGLVSGIASVGQWGLDLARRAGIISEDTYAKASNGVSDWSDKVTEPWKNYKEDLKAGLAQAGEDISTDFNTNLSNVKSVVTEAGKSISKSMDKLTASFQDRTDEAKTAMKTNAENTVKAIEQGSEDVSASVEENSGDTVITDTEETKTLGVAKVNDNTLGKAIQANIAGATIIGLYYEFNNRLAKLKSKGVLDGDGNFISDGLSVEELKRNTNKLARLNKLGGIAEDSNTLYQELVKDGKVDEKFSLKKVLFDPIMKNLFHLDTSNLSFRMIDDKIDSFFVDLNTSLMKGLNKLKESELTGEASRAINDFMHNAIREFQRSTISSLSTSIAETTLSNMGDLSTYISTAKTGYDNGGGWGAILNVVMQLLANMLAKLEEVSGKVSFVFNSIDTILELFEDTFIPIFDEFLTPFVDGFAAVKDIIGGIFNVIGAFIKNFTVIGSYLTKLLNSIAPAVVSILNLFASFVNVLSAIWVILEPIIIAINYILKVIATVVTWAANIFNNMFTGIYNAIIWIYNLLNGWGKDKEYKDYVDINSGVDTIWNGYDQSETEALLANAIASAATSTTTGASASYSAQRDIYLTLNFEQSYIGGGPEEIAIDLYNRIKDAKKLGLVS